MNCSSSIISVYQFHLISWMSDFVNFIPHNGHFRFRLFWVSSMHFLQNKWEHVFKATSLSRYPVQMHIILSLYSRNYNFSTSSSDFWISPSTRLFSCLISDFRFYFSPCSFDSCFSLSFISSCKFFIEISFSKLYFWVV